LATIAVPLFPIYFPGEVAVRGGTVILGSPGNQVCTSTGPSAPRCTLSGDGIAVLDAVHGRLRRVLRVPQHAWAVGIDGVANRILVASATGVGTASTVVTILDAATGRPGQRTGFAGAA